jgi:hypothetical protein
LTDPPPDADSSFSSDFLIYLLGRAHYQQFLRLRRELDQHGLAEADWFVLSILSTGERQSVAQLEALLAYTGPQVTHDQTALLAAAGFVKLHGAYYPDVLVSLTERVTRRSSSSSPLPKPSSQMPNGIWATGKLGSPSNGCGRSSMILIPAHR